jgi:Rrf2 family protein
MLACEGDLCPGKAMTSEAIARSVNTNPVVVRRVLADLRRAGLVETRRGVGGGVALAKPATKITLRCVWEALEGGEQLFARHPSGPNPSCPVGAVVAGYLEDLYGHAEDLLKTSLGKVTLAELQRQISLRLSAGAAAAH